ncbi:hypothetical protein SAMD00079811_45090 [Scytonema sp. HK-05]|nr:hypothetical protein SAMD00079811_45090 [Scytonema sp. HK-05]
MAELFSPTALPEILHHSQQEPEALISRYQVEPGNEGLEAEPPQALQKHARSQLPS